MLKPWNLVNGEASQLDIITTISRHQKKPSTWQVVNGEAYLVCLDIINTINHQQLKFTRSLLMGKCIHSFPRSLMSSTLLKLPNKIHQFWFSKPHTSNKKTEHLKQETEFVVPHVIVYPCLPLAVGGGKASRGIPKAFKLYPCQKCSLSSPATWSPLRLFLTFFFFLEMAALGLLSELAWSGSWHHSGIELEWVCKYMFIYEMHLYRSRWWEVRKRNTVKHTCMWMRTCRWGFQFFKKPNLSHATCWLPGTAMSSNSSDISSKPSSCGTAFLETMTASESGCSSDNSSSCALTVWSKQKHNRLNWDFGASSTLKLDFQIWG